MKQAVVLVIISLLLPGALCAQASKEFRAQLVRNLKGIPKDLRADARFQSAYRHFVKGENDSTIVYSGLYLAANSRDKRLVDYVRYFRGRSFFNKGLYKNSLQDLQRISSQFPFPSLVLLSKGEALFALEDYDMALKYYLQVKKSAQSKDLVISISAINNNIGLCYMFREDYANAEKYLLESLHQQLSSADTVKIISGYIDVANLYYTQYLDDKAIPYFIKAYDLAQKTNNFELKRSASLNMSIVEENRGDLEKSLEYRKEYDRWKDSTNNQEKVWEIAQIEKRHLAETKQREIGLLQRENALKSKERNAILIGAGVLLLVLVLIIYFYYQKIRSSAIIAEQRESLDKLNAFKNRLFSIVSHDLRSSVHGLRRSTEQLRSEIPNEDSKLKSLVNQQGAIANSTYGMLDNLLNWALLQSDEIYFHPEKVSLKRLLPQVVLNYQPLLDQKKIHLELDIPLNAKVNADIDSLKIVLRNVLDNAIKFTPEEGQLRISAEVDADLCRLYIKDSGSGMTQEQLSIVLEQSSQVSKESKEERSGTGLGVRLCASFMSKNNGSFQIESEKGVGTTVILSFEKA